MDTGELEPVLREHLSLLEYSLQHPSLYHSPQYKVVAGQLRVLLCDAVCPLLLRFAEYRNIPLYVWAPPSILKELEKGLTLSLNYDVAKWTPNDMPMVKRKITDYLDCVIGNEPICDGQGAIGAPYSPRNLIKWVANKEGICHYDFKKPKVLQSLQKWMLNSNGQSSDAAIIRNHIIAIGIWCARAIRELLELPKEFGIGCKVKLRSNPEEDAPLFGLVTTNCGDGFRVLLRDRELVVEKTTRLNGRNHDTDRRILAGAISEELTLFVDCLPSQGRIVFSTGDQLKEIFITDARYIQLNESLLTPTSGYGHFFNARLYQWSRVLKDSDKILFTELLYDQCDTVLGSKLSEDNAILVYTNVGIT